MGRPTSCPPGQVAFVRTGPTQSGQWGIVFTLWPTGVTTEPRHSLLHDKGGTYKGGQAAPHESGAFVRPRPLPLKRVDQRGLPGGRRFTGSGAKQQPLSQLLPLLPPPGSRVQEGPWDGKVRSPPPALTKGGSFLVQMT